MFKLKSCYKGIYHIVNQRDDYLHSNGGIFQTPEYWPTKELAQIVLNKYQPKHVWEHGDIATTRRGGQRLFINIGGKLRIYDDVSQICTGSASIQYWAECFGYKKIGNVFGFGL